MKSIAFIQRSLVILLAFVYLVSYFVNDKKDNTAAAPASSPDLDYWENFERQIDLCKLFHASSKEEFSRCVDAIELPPTALEVGDCDDYDSTVFPGAPELCDGKDNNHVDGIDENCIPTETISIPHFDQVRSTTWHIPEGIKWITPVPSKVTHCGEDRQSFVRGGFDVVVPQGTTIEASFTKEEKAAMWMAGYRPDCLYWSSVDFDSRARLLPNNVWVCDPISR